MGVEKHLAGKHDQSTHAGGHRSLGNYAPIGSLVGKSSTSSVQLSQSETDALDGYVTKGRHLDVNTYLRDGSDWLSPEELDRAKYMDKELTNAINKSELLQDTELVRGVGYQAFSSIDLDSKNISGQTFIDKGFMSTTKSNFPNDAFTGAIKMNIKAPKGTKALDVTQVFDNRYTQFDQEILLQKGLTYKILDVTNTIYQSGNPYAYEMNVEIVK